MNKYTLTLRFKGKRFLFTLTENQRFYICFGSVILLGGSLLPMLIKLFCKALVLTF